MTLRRTLAGLLLAAGIATASAGALAQFGFGSSSGDSDKGVLAGLISRALSTPATRVSIGDVEGALSSDATVRNIEISDRDGVWLRLDRARIVWRRLALLQRRLEIDRLEVGILDIRRRPIPAEGQVAGEDQPILPELPVKVEIKAFNLAELQVGEPLLGTEARVTATGAARLSNNLQEGLDLTFDARRLDQPGTLAARLGLVPQGQRLTLMLKVDEPAGGILARAASLPGQPPVKFNLDGEGTLDAFAARLALDAGDGLGANGSANLSRQGAVRRLALDLQAKVEGLLPEAAAPVFAGTTRLTGNAGFADDGTITLTGINLAAAAARLDIAGTISRDGIADLTIAAANVPTTEGRTVTGPTEIRRLAFQGRVTGPVTAPNVDATLALEDARTPAGRLARLDATFRAATAGVAPSGATQLAITGDARASGLAPFDPALARAIGETVAFTLRGMATTKAVLDVETLNVTTPTLTARYAGRLGSDEVRGRLGFEAATLRPFSGIAGLALAGQANVSAEIEGTPRANRVNATVDGRIAGFATGLGAVDGLFGGRLGLTGTVRVEPTGGYGFETLRLAGEHASAEVNGRVAQDSAGLRVSAILPDLGRADERLTGRATLTADVTGGLQRPNVVAELALLEATALGRAVPRLALGVDVKDATGALDGTIRLDGIVDGKPARGGFRIARPEAGGYRLDALDLAIGSVALRGGLSLDARNLAFGRVTLDAGDLNDLTPLLLTPASGSLAADVALDSTGARQNARIQARGGPASAYGASLQRLDADLSLTDLYGRVALAGRAAIDEVVAAGETISRVRLDATGRPDESDISLTAVARGFDLDAKARVVPGDRTRIELSKLDARRGDQRIGLAEPSTLTVVGGGVEIGNLAVALGQGRLLVRGTAGTKLDLTVEARRVPLAAAELASPGLGLAGTLDGQARVTGTALAPTGAFRFTAAGITAPQTRAAALPAIEALLAGQLAGGRVLLEGSRVSVGRSADLRIDGSAPLAATGLLDLAVKGQVDAAAANGFFGGSTVRLAGAVDLDAKVGGTLAAPEVALNAQAARFATGLAAADGLLGARPTLIGRVSIPPAGGYRFDDLRLTGAAATARVDGAVTADQANLVATVAAPDLARADSRLTGAAEATARITGTLARPDADLRISVTNATALGRPVPRLVLEAVARDLLGQVDARVTLDGEIDRRPARGTLHAARRPDGSALLEGLDVTIGSVRAQGGVTLDAANIARGRLTVNAPNLDDLSPLLLTKVVGTLDADVTLGGEGGGQDARVKANATRVSVYGTSVEKAEADLTLTDIYRRPIVSGQARVDEATVAGEQISRVRLDARGTPQSSDVTLKAAARGFDLDAAARIVPGDRTRIEISRLAATRDRQRFALANPATVTIVPGGADLRDVALALGTGRVTLNGIVGSRLDLRAEARDVPLSAADAFAPGLGLAGTFEGTAQIAGTTSAPTGEYRAKIDGLTAPQTRSLGLPRIDVTASGRLASGRATLDALVAAGRAGSLRIGGSLPAGGAGALDLTIRGNIDAGSATTGLLASGGRRFTGRVDVDARVGGTLSAPEASGSANLAGGTFSDAGQGIQFTNIGARIVARGQEVTIEGGRASTRNGGSLTASGRVRLDPGAGFPGEIRIAGQNAELVRSGIVTAVANLNLGISGALARNPRVAGRVDLVSADVAVPENLSATQKPLPNTRHRNPTRTTTARLAVDAKAKGQGGRAAPPFDAILDLTLNAPGRIVVRGRGLNAELGGRLRLTGTLAKPVPNGAFNLQRGTLQIVTSRLDFSRGRLTFSGDLTPELDFVASTNSGGAAIQVAVNGPANNPNFAFTSSPDLPQDEVLSRLLFNSPSGQLSAFQAIALAQAAAQFSGGEGGDAFEGLRRSLGLSGLDVGLGASGGIGAGLQRAFGDRVSVGIKGGVSAADTGLGIDVRITDEIRLQADVGAGGSSSVGIGGQYEW
ncbi:translocation/assembly module TamB domain-containing protein [uncultured Enterovirga sp.]|uniref:translocation/assembly module TamB domain-containing protein n=1 Tax=uncultured Enterovirga sp. TaxID=2026352 RepID=UPI0035CABD8B